MLSGGLACCRTEEAATNLPGTRNVRNWSPCPGPTGLPNCRYPRLSRNCTLPQGQVLRQSKQFSRSSHHALISERFKSPRLTCVCQRCSDKHMGEMKCQRTVLPLAPSYTCASS